jgi:hypothetical protein
MRCLVDHQELGSWDGFRHGAAGVWWSQRIMLTSDDECGGFNGVQLMHYVDFEQFAGGPQQGRQSAASGVADERREERWSAPVPRKSPLAKDSP